MLDKPIDSNWFAVSPNRLLDNSKPHFSSGVISQTEKRLCERIPSSIPIQSKPRNLKNQEADIERKASHREPQER